MEEIAPQSSETPGHSNGSADSSRNGGSLDSVTEELLAMVGENSKVLGKGSRLPHFRTTLEKGGKRHGQ